MKEFYFERPKQVIFADPDNPGEWLSGIAYGHDIICGCCGGVFNVDDVAEAAYGDGLNSGIYEYGEWNDISNEITGGEMPAGLELSENGIIESEDDEFGAIEDEESSEYESYYYKNLE